MCYKLQCGEDEEDGHIDLYDEVLVITREAGGHLTDDEKHEGGQEDRHDVAGERPAQSDVHEHPGLSSFVDVAVVDGLEDVLQQLPGACVDNLLAPQSDLPVRHVEHQRAVLRVERIPPVVKLTDKLAAELPLLDHHVVLAVEEERVLLLRQTIRYILKLFVGYNLQELQLLCPLALVLVLHAVELYERYPDTFLVIFEYEIVAVLLEILISEMLIEPMFL